MIILAIESTTEACSVALFNNGSITELFEIAPRQHTNLLLNMLDSLLKQQGIVKHELDAIAFCRGPGAFTGLRITTGVAQGLAFGLNIPLVAISSLAALAQGAYRYNQSQKEQSEQNNFLACLDARKSEVFWGLFCIKNGFAKPLVDESVSASEKIVDSLRQLNRKVKNWQVVGTAAKIVAHLNEPSLLFVDSPTENYHYPHAYDVVVLAAKEYKLGNTVAVEQAVPVYLRNNVTY